MSFKGYNYGPDGIFKSLSLKWMSKIKKISPHRRGGRRNFTNQLYSVELLIQNTKIADGQ